MAVSLEIKDGFAIEVHSEDLVLNVVEERSSTEISTVTTTVEARPGGTTVEASTTAVDLIVEDRATTVDVESRDVTLEITTAARVEVTSPVTSIVEIVTEGPQGPAGPAGADGTQNLFIGGARPALTNVVWVDTSVDPPLLWVEDGV